MTDSGRVAQNTDQRRTDNNRQRKIEAVSCLQRLLTLASDPKFRGTVTIEVNAKDGTLGSVRATHSEIIGQ